MGENGRPYYYNLETEESTYEKPMLWKPTDEAYTKLCNETMVKRAKKADGKAKDCSPGVVKIARHEKIAIDVDLREKMMSRAPVSSPTKKWPADKDHHFSNYIMITP